MLGYLSRERYHCPITIIKIVKTKGKAGYLVWKLAGGQGDQGINLPWGSFVEFKVFFFFGDNVSVANPLLISNTKIYFNKNKKKVESLFLFFQNFTWKEGTVLIPMVPIRLASFHK